MNTALEEAFSTERLDRYRAWAGGDTARALDLYALNTRLSEALYPPLQTLEITLRNRIHAVLAADIGERWFETPDFLRPARQQDRLAAAIDNIAQTRKEPTPGRIVATLTFGFWTAMLGSGYESLWRTGLHRIARRENGRRLKRKDFSKPLHTIRTLRNRIAHHEPIIHWDLRRHHDTIIQLTGWLSPAAADWCLSHSRLPSILPEGRIIPVQDRQSQP